MKAQRTIRRTMLAMALAAIGASGSALAVSESTDANQPIQSAQPVTVGGAGSVTVEGAIAHFGTSQPDVDFYTFDAVEGDVITVDIDETTNGLDGNLTLFGPGPAFPKLMWSSDEPLDAGSTTEADPRIDAFRLPATGRYTVAVSSFPVFFNSGGTMTSTRTLSSGGYKLVISGVTPPIQFISLDIKPGNTQPTALNPKSKGVVPVALLSSKDFNALDVDVSTLTFGATGDEKTYQRCLKNGQDVNGDGLLDLVCHFDNEFAGFRRGDSAGVVKGKTKGAKMFQGRGDLKVTPEKRGE